MATKGSTPVEALYGLGISHNKCGIMLPDGTPYADHAGDLSGRRAREFLTHFNRVRDKKWPDCTFLDLGCSEGSTTFEISQMGSTVYGVEGRADGVHRADVLKSVLGFDRTHFSVGNVDHPESYREVDGIFNAGILYHLEDPVACLERCAENARQFIYLDTGHAPRDEAERQNSKFVRQFGDTFTISYKGLELEAVDFAEPGITAEKQEGGLRRGPRSGIGNTNSVWLSHRSTVELMAQLGFPYHETVRDTPRLARLRTCFFRTPPKPLKALNGYLQPLTMPLPPAEAAMRTRERDLAYIHSRGEPVLLMGREPMLAQVRQDLRDAGVAISDEVLLPGDPPTRRHTLDELTKGKDGMVVVAAPDFMRLIRELVFVDRFSYAFASFAKVRLTADAAEPASAASPSMTMA